MIAALHAIALTFGPPIDAVCACARGAAGPAECVGGTTPLGSDVLAELSHLNDADAALDRAIDCWTNESEWSFLRGRRQELSETIVRRGPG